MFSAHHLIMIYMCTKLRENISKGSRVSGTDRWMDKVITKGLPQTFWRDPHKNTNALGEGVYKL